MSILQDLDFDNLPEIGAVPNGEYQVTIVDASDYISNTSGKPSIRVLLDIPGEATADTIYHYLPLPTPDDDEKKSIRNRARIKQFLESFGLTKDMDYQDWVGKTAWALIQQEKGQNGEPRNAIRRFIGMAGQSAMATGGSEYSDIPF